MTYYCYVLVSETTGSYYIGSSHSIDDRLQVHNQGRNRSTKPGIPWKLAGYKQYKTRPEAFSEEQRLKKMKNRIRLENWLREKADVNLL